MSDAPQTIPDYQHEPAVSIGELFADQAKLKTLVTAIIGVLVVAGINVAPGVSDNIVTILNILVPIVLGGLGYGAMTTQARTQAAETREKVYSPATVRELTQTERVTAALDTLQEASKQESTRIQETPQ